MSRRVAITGATGFVGLALAERLRARGDSVAALVRAGSAPAAVTELSRLGCRLVEGDVTAPATLPPLLEGADAVVHSAAVIAYRPRLRARMDAVNVEGTRHMLAAARATGTGRFLHVSSIAAISISDTPTLLDEQADFAPARALRAGYFESKHAAERLVLDAAAHGLDALAVNPGAIYGPSRVVSNSSRIVLRVASGRLRLAPTGGLNVVTLDTVVEGLVAALQRGRSGQRYVLGGENLHTAELLAAIAQAAGRSLRPWRVPAVCGPPLRALMNAFDGRVPESAWYTPDLCAAFGRWMWFDGRRMREELGVQPAPLQPCLEATVAALRQSGQLA